MHTVNFSGLQSETHTHIINEAAEASCAADLMSWTGLKQSAVSVYSCEDEFQFQTLGLSGPHFRTVHTWAQVQLQAK